MPNWSDFFGQTGGLRQPVVIRDFFDILPVGEAEVLEIFRRVGAKHNGKLMTTLRAYQGGRREQHEYKILASPPGPGATLRSWYGFIFDGDGSAIILNRVERWSSAVANFMGELNAAFLGIESSLLRDAESVLFIGDYGYSPFGVHLDYDSTMTIHVPLTPAPKSMFLWSEAGFLEATGSHQSNFEPDSILESGTRYEYRAGDVFFLPPQFYHVGYSPSFTVSLAIVLSTIARPHHLDNLPRALGAHFGSGWAECEDVQALPFRELSRMAERDHALRRSSNLGLSAPLEYAAEFILEDHDRPFQLVRPFKIHHQLGKGLLMYIRGNAIRLKPGADERHVRDIRYLIEVLNSGEILSVNLATYVAKSLHVEAISYLIQMLVRLHVLEVVDLPGMACPKRR